MWWKLNNSTYWTFKNLDPITTYPPMINQSLLCYQTNLLLPVAKVERTHNCSTFSSSLMAFLACILKTSGRKSLLPPQVEVYNKVKLVQENKMKNIYILFKPLLLTRIL